MGLTRYKGRVSGVEKKYYRLLTLFRHSFVAQTLLHSFHTPHTTHHSQWTLKA